MPHSPTAVPTDSVTPPPFRPIAINALYSSIQRGLSADILAARGLDGSAFPVCSTLAVAGHGVVTDVLNVPTDTVAAQIEHLFETTAPTSAKVGIVGHRRTVDAMFDLLETHLDGPLLLDLTLSGPSGEDIVSQRCMEALTERLELPDLVAVRRHDAELIAGMEIPSLDDAQVAVQRIADLGAQRVVMRCGQIATHHFDTDSDLPEYAVDLYYDGDDFALYEAPLLDADDIHGASSAYLMCLLRALETDTPFTDALQEAKAHVTEALRHGQQDETLAAPDYFWNYMEGIATS